MLRLIFFAICALLGVQALANDLEHKNAIINILSFQAEHGNFINFPFISTLSRNRENGSFSKSSGQIFFTIGSEVTSAYDNTVKYNVSDFYKSANYRNRFIINVPEPITKSYISIGYDSGSQAEKLQIGKSYYLGFSSAIILSNKSYITTSFGVWKKQDLVEVPCLDSYDREYYCPNLTAWTDRTPINLTQDKYIDIRYIVKF